MMKVYSQEGEHIFKIRTSYPIALAAAYQLTYKKNSAENLCGHPETCMPKSVKIYPCGLLLIKLAALALNSTYSVLQKFRCCLKISVIISIMNAVLKSCFVISASTMQTQQSDSISCHFKQLFQLKRNIPKTLAHLLLVFSLRVCFTLVQHLFKQSQQVREAARTERRPECIICQSQ